MCAHQDRSYVRHVSNDDRHRGTSSEGSTTGDEDTQHYEIRVKGHLGDRWSAWFDGFTITDRDDGTSVLHGPVVDQAALHGLLHKLRDVGIPLISLAPTTTDASIERPAPTTEGT